MREMLNVGLYKPAQGKITRQVTAVTIAVVLGFGVYRLYAILSASLKSAENSPENAGWFANGVSSISAIYPQYTIPLLLIAIVMWAAYRTVNFAPFADFLVAVEAEMRKVSWPSRDQLYRASVVVIAVIFVLAALLFIYDFIWQSIFTYVIPILNVDG